MAAERVMISGVMYIGKSAKGQRVTIVGYSGNPDLVIGGGPVIPPEGPPVETPPDAHPEHPIVIPEPPEEFPNPPEVVKPPPAEGGWAFVVPPGVWVFVPGSGQAGPKR